MQFKLPSQYSLKFGALVSGIFLATGTLMHAQDPDTILVYQQTGTITTDDYVAGSASTQTRTRTKAFVVLNTEDNTYRTITLDTENKEYSISSESTLSSKFLSEDSRGRDLVVISLQGPGAEWDYDDRRNFAEESFSEDEIGAVLNTLTGTERRLRLRVNGEIVRVRDQSSSLRGGYRREAHDSDTDNRNVDDGTISLRLDTRRTVEAINAVVTEGDEINEGVAAVEAYLATRSYSETP